MAICALAAVAFPLLALFDALLPFDTGYALELPSRMQGTVTLSRPRENWRPEFHGATSEGRASFRYKGLVYDVVTINYARQSQGAEMIFGGNRLFDKKRWVRDYEAELPAIPGYRVLPLAGRRGQNRLIAYWYVVGGITTDSDVAAKVLDILGRVTRRTGASVVAVSVTGPYEQTHESLQTVVSRLRSQLDP